MEASRVFARHPKISKELFTIILSNLLAVSLVLILCWRDLASINLVCVSAVSIEIILAVAMWAIFGKTGFIEVRVLIFFRAVISIICSAGFILVLGFDSYFQIPEFIQNFGLFFAILSTAIVTIGSVETPYPILRFICLPFFVSVFFRLFTQYDIFLPTLLPTLVFGPGTALFAWRFHQIILRSRQFHRENSLLMTQLTMQKERADLANAAKTRFLSAASHDLRQPLHALRLFIAQIKGNSIASEKRPVVQKIDASAQAINELIDNLLDISRLEAGSIKPVYSEFLINDILGRIENSFLAMAHQKQLTLRVVPSKLIVHSDIVLLERILANLVSNAVRYTDHGAILIGCRRRGDQLRIEVRDSGAGIAADQAAEIFLGFYKPKNSRAKGQNRTGLGLAIVERLCILLRHSISFESAIGQGSCFVVEIPLAQIVIKNTQIDPIHFSQQQLNELSP